MCLGFMNYYIFVIDHITVGDKGATSHLLPIIDLVNICTLIDTKCQKGLSRA